MASPKVQSISKSSTPQGELRPANAAELIDECAMLIEKVAPMQKRRDALKDEIASWHPELTAPENASDAKLAKCANTVAREEGHDYVIDIGVQSHETKITGLDRLYKLLTLKPFLRFVEMCRPTQKALDASLKDPLLKIQPDPAIRKEFLVTTQTGYRHYSITKKFGEAA